MSQKRICILGGGFGGLYTALRLSQFPWNSPDKPEIILVEQNDRFLFSPLLYELLTGELQSWEIAPPFSELLADTTVRFVQGAVTNIDVRSRSARERESHQVQLKDGQNITCDRLVLALGGETPTDRVPGCADYAIPFRTINDAYRLQEKLRELENSDPDKIRVAIVGGGYSGVELACKLADRLGERGRVRLVEASDSILRSASEFNRTAAMRSLKERGIWIDLETTVDRIEADSISLIYREQIDNLPVDIVLWTVGTEVSPVVRSLPLKQNQRGQLTTTATLQAIDHPDIFVLGDLADCQDASEQRVPSTAQAAIQQADYAAWNIWASLTERPLLPFRYQSLGEMMTLGLDNATLTGLGVKLDGPAAHILRRLIYLYRLPTLDHQLKVGFNWIVQPLREMLSS
jgi:demethylphylloquinone reductase